MTRSIRSAKLVSEISVCWSIAASSTAIYLGFGAQSAVLIAFGCIGYVDAVGSIALIHHFRHGLRNVSLEDRFERRAHLLVTWGLVVVGFGIAGLSCLKLIRNVHAVTQVSGVALAVTSVVVLTTLALTKRRLAARVESPALRADGNLSGVGAAQAGMALLGLAANEWLSWRSADAVAAIVLGIAAVILGIRSFTEVVG